MDKLIGNAMHTQLKISFDNNSKNQRTLFKELFSLLSARAKNILEGHDLDSYEEFVKYLNIVGINNFKKFRNCGKLTEMELKSFAQNFIMNEFNVTDIEEKQHTPPQKINFSSKRKILFKVALNNLSARSKHILIDNNYRELSLFYYSFLSGSNIDFINLKNCDATANDELIKFKEHVKEILKCIEPIEPGYFFYDFNEYYLKYYRKVEQDIFINYFNYRLNDGSLKTLESIGHSNNLSRERIRQISVNLKERLSKNIAELRKESNYAEYYFRDENYIFVDDQLLNDINIREKTSFSKSFVNLCLAKVLPSDFQFIEIINENRTFDGIFIRNVNSFNLKRLFTHLKKLIDLKRTHDQKFTIKEIINQFNDNKTLTRAKYETIISAIKLFCESYSKYNNQKITFINDSIVLSSNSKIFLYQHIIELLDLYKKPMHYKKIFTLLKENGINFKSPVSAHATLMSFPKIFGLKGSGIYGLIKWGGYFGSIGDVTERYLKEKGKPIYRNELVDFLCYELIISKDSINYVLFKYEHENRFIKLENNKIGLTTWREKP